MFNISGENDVKNDASDKAVQYQKSKRILADQDIISAYLDVGHFALGSHEACQKIELSLIAMKNQEGSSPNKLVISTLEVIKVCTLTQQVLSLRKSCEGYLYTEEAVLKGLQKIEDELANVIQYYSLRQMTLEQVYSSMIKVLHIFKDTFKDQYRKTQVENIVEFLAETKPDASDLSAPHSHEFYATLKLYSPSLKL